MFSQVRDVKAALCATALQLLARFLFKDTPLCWLYQPTLLCVCFFLSALGLAVACGFYWFAVRHVFNREPKPSPAAFYAFLSVVRPLGLVWRFFTCAFRVTPDIYILGETRTGTTTLAAHLRTLGAVGPFTPWVHPLADHKESFFMSGHYWGLVTPFLYRMCFPLQLEQWWATTWCHKQQPLVFDGCASYLVQVTKKEHMIRVLTIAQEFLCNHLISLYNFVQPWVAHLLSVVHTARKRDTPKRNNGGIWSSCVNALTGILIPPAPRPIDEVRVLVCLREPSSQNLSWWKLEKGAMAWGTGMGLGETWRQWQTSPMMYPPPSFESACEASRGEELDFLYVEAEENVKAQILSTKSNMDEFSLLKQVWLGGTHAAFPMGSHAK